MERRRVLAGLAAVPLLGVGKGRPGMSNVNELASEFERLEAKSVTAPPASVLEPTRHTYFAAADAANAASGPVRRETSSIAARLAVLAGWSCFGGGNYRETRGWYLRARRWAVTAGDVDTTAWIYARESSVPMFYEAYPMSVEELAERGLAFLPERSRSQHPAASLLMLRAAHAFAEKGQGWEARTMVDAAERIAPGPPGSQLHLGPGEQTRVAAKVFTELGDVNEADVRHATGAGHQHSPGQRALLGLDRARCLLRAGQVDVAATVAAETWSRLPEDQRTAPLRFYARRLAIDLQPWRGQAHVDHYLAVPASV